LTIKLFNTKYAADNLIIGEEYYFYGKMEGDLLAREMNSPEAFPSFIQNKIIPQYNATKGLSTNIILSNIKEIMPKAMGQFPETIPTSVQKQFGLMDKNSAIQNIHFPKNMEMLEKAERTLIFEELFILQLALSHIKNKNNKNKGVPMNDTPIDEYYSSLPYTLSDGQLSAINDIITDITKKNAMNRIIEGDVGCGKTAVAVAAMYFAYKNGYQSVLMAPTEVLATQHYENITKALAPFGVKVSLLTGSISAKEKKEVYASLVDGETNICIGTHAIISKATQFKNLALVITDEQHRFGVNQRAKLLQKGENPYVLVMSATPIPRTLSLIIYGDLDISVISELPKGRQKIDTLLIGNSKRERSYNFIKTLLSQGRQAYIVCPLIEESEKLSGLKTVAEYAEEISHNQFKGFSVAILHGKMKPSEKEQIMQDFKVGNIQLLISTTVIEVGIDVPNAVVMFIEDADRFGLSQLHQLRGRVGRGKEKSYCILMTQTKSRDTFDRLENFCKTSDGFEIAMQDLALRGAGDVLGNRQHGLPTMKIANMARDTTLLEDAQKAAKLIIEKEIPVTNKEYFNIRSHINKILNSVGEKLN
ncbi:MAG: ATP-dependent DNA helicase RecG, partial [Oscillospiraceae bacterium]